jgi:circadian clock protein KaiC
MIDDKGLHLGKPFRDVSGILSGYPSGGVPNELEQIGGLFTDEKDI